MIDDDYFVILYLTINSEIRWVLSYTYICIVNMQECFVFQCRILTINIHGLINGK